MKPRTLSREEEAELARSNKKVKDSRHAEFNEGPSDGSPSRSNQSHWNNANASFRDKLVGKIPGAFAQAFDFTEHMDADSDSENDDEDINDLREGLMAIKLSKDTKKRIRERWCKAVIVKLVGRSMTSYMQSKLNQLWKPEERMDVVDQSHGFFLVWFYSKDNLNSVLRRGPWFLGDHFLSLRPWEPFFKPSSANVSLVAVWIRLYELPIELYEAEVLRQIGESIGKVLRIDTHTAMEARGKYARLCIQIDINKPLINTILIGQFEQSVNYEGIQKLCFSCGRLGHLKEACPYTVRKGKDSVDTAEVPLNGNAGSCVEHEICCTDAPSTLPDNSTSGKSVVEEGACQYGPWMVVTRKKGGYKGTNLSPASGGSTKSAVIGNQLPSKGSQTNFAKDGPTGPYKEMGLRLNKESLSIPSLGLALRDTTDVARKPDSPHLIGPSLHHVSASSKKQNPPSVRGKKSIARNSSSSTSFSRTVLDPSQAFSSKLTSLSASTSFSPPHGPEPHGNSSFVFMAAMEDGLGCKSNGDGDRIPSGDILRDQSKFQAHTEAEQTEGEGSLGFEIGQAGMCLDLQSRKGSDVVDGDDKMASEEGGDLGVSY